MKTEKNVNAGIRLVSMLLDHFIMVLICMLFFIPMMVEGFGNAFTISHDQKEFVFFSGPLSYIGLFGFALYFCKDCINGRSIAKRILKLQVADNATAQVATPIKCFIRNIFCGIWPIEVIVTLINPTRRIGDRVAGTKIVSYYPGSEQPTTKTGQVLISIALSFGFLLLLSLLFKAVRPTFNKINYVEASYDDSASKALEKLYADSMGQYLTADVRVYNKIENQNLKYISVIYKLKENYLEDRDMSQELRNATMEHVHSMFPANTFTGRAQYVFQASGIMQTTTIKIGISIKENKKE